MTPKVPTLELRLLTLGARTVLDGEARHRLDALLREGPDWGDVIFLAQQHHVAALLHRTLDGAAASKVPANALETLWEARAGTVARNLRIMSELFAVLAADQSRGLEAVPLKGPAIATALYGDLSIRPSSDLDLLVRPEDLDEIHDVLGARGFELAMDPSQAGPGGKHRSYLHAVDLLHVEIHWRFSPLYAIDEPIWRRVDEGLGTIEVLGRKLPMLPPELLLVVLCVHGAHHRWERLKWVCDVAELLREHPALDYARVERLARPIGCERVVQLGVLLASEFLGARRPPGLTVHPTVSRIAGGIARDWSRRTLPQRGLLGWMRFHAGLQPTWKDRLSVMAYYLDMAAAPPERGGHDTWKGRVSRALLGRVRSVGAAFVRVWSRGA